MSGDVRSGTVLDRIGGKNLFTEQNLRQYRDAVGKEVQDQKESPISYFCYKKGIIKNIQQKDIFKFRCKSR